MNSEELLSRLGPVRRCGNSWIATCPAHDDRRPSLRLREGEHGLLVKCWAGCSLKAITAALGIEVRDFFYNAPLTPGTQKRRQDRPWRFDWRRTAFEFQFYADGLWLRAQSVLEAARELNTTDWTDEEQEVAINAVARAYADLEWSDLLEGVAFKLRLRGLNKERQRSEARSAAA